MKSTSRFLTGIAVASLAVTATSVSAATIVADTVIEYFDSGAGPQDGPYGSNERNQFPVPVPLSFATDENATTSVSLPTGSFITLGFSTGSIFDADNAADIFISEPGAASEVADVFVSGDFGATFEFLGQADGGRLTELDLADINFTGFVNAVRIVGLDNGGASPGFDVAFVQGLEGSVVTGPQGPVTTPPVSAVPLPATGGMVLLGLAAIGAMRRRQK